MIYSFFADYKNENNSDNNNNKIRNDNILNKMYFKLTIILSLTFGGFDFWMDSVSDFSVTKVWALALCKPELSSWLTGSGTYSLFTISISFDGATVVEAEVFESIVVSSFGGGSRI